MRGFRADSGSTREHFQGKHRFEHWYRDRTVYFITSGCRDHFPAFATEEAKLVFWDRFAHYSAQHGFAPWVTSLLGTHYHTLGYLHAGEELGEMMRKLHGSVAKLTNDRLQERRLPFWREKGGHNYFDGCIRNELQCRRAYRYTLRQSVRHGICRDWRDYPHTRVNVELEAGVRRALQLNAFMNGIPYPRYERGS